MRRNTAILLLALTGFIPVTARERKLSCEITPIPCDNIIESRIWDLSFQRILSDDSPTTITLHGDT